MFSDSAIQFLRDHQQNIVERWRRISEEELSPEFTGSSWFRDTTIEVLFSQIIDAFSSRVYRDLNRTIDSLVHAEETPSPLYVKSFLTGLARAAADELNILRDTVDEADRVESDLSTMGRTLKKVYSERLMPDLIDVLEEHYDDLRERWLRDLPTKRVSDVFSLLSDEDREAFVDQTMEVYDAVLRGRDGDPVPNPHTPQETCSRFEAWIVRQVDYFMPRGFRIVDLILAVNHLPRLLEPLLARALTHDLWAYRVSVLLLHDARSLLVSGLADSYMEQFSRDFYGEVGIMLHRIKNKLTSVPSTMRTVLAIGDEQYGTLFDPMVLTVDEAGVLTQYMDLLVKTLRAGSPVVDADEKSTIDPDAMAKLRDAYKELRGYLGEHGELLHKVRQTKLDTSAVEMLHEMLGIVLEGGTQTEQLAMELQLRMNEMYERERPRWEALSIHELVNDATREAEVDARAKHIDFVTNVDAEGLQIYGVRRDISRPFVQVIDNAIKYTPQEGTVVVTLEKEGSEHVLFSCRDTGIGIPPGEEEQVFALCERCSNAKDFASGTGTGLYHDRITVQHHNGEMWVESGGVGQGSTFFIRLPIHRERVAEGVSGD